MHADDGRGTADNRIEVEVMEMDVIFFGSCRMDKGEGLQYITDAVQRAAKQKPKKAFFDVIATPGSEAQAAALLTHFYQLAARHFKDCKSTDIFGGVSSNLNVRPAAMALAVVQRMNEHDVAWFDQNPTREKGWEK